MLVPRIVVILRPSTLVCLQCGTEHAAFSATRQASRTPSAKRREVFGESYEGWAASYEYVLRTTCEAAFRTLWVLSCVSDGGFELFDFVSGVATSRDINGDTL